MNKSRTLAPRPRIYDLYWYFAAERLQIYERRLAGSLAPWTDDAVLQEFKFCIVYRATDRVSQYLIREVCYGDESVSAADRLFQIVAFRMFSRIETWQAVQQFLGHSLILQDLASGRFTQALVAAKQRNGGLYTGAFILCATDAYGQTYKHLNHIELFRQMFLQDGLDQRPVAAGSLREVYELLHAYPLMGDFMSYQVAIDLNYSALINFTENDFTKAGPGALRGMKKVFMDLGDCTPDEAVLWMVAQQGRQFERIGLPFGGLRGRPLMAIDAQGLFCEVDKYCREAVPELVSARKRIKLRFRPTGVPKPLFFPPKWGLNDSAL